MTEIWKDVKGYEGLYKVSNHGEVWSERKQGLLKKGKGGREYYRVVLTKNKEKKYFDVHRLVAISFVDNPFKKSCVNHLDENKTNNHYSNLEWVTHKENSNWGTAIERRKTKQSKPIVGVNKKNGEIIEFPSINEAGRNGYHTGPIWSCLNGKQPKHKGYKWFYKKNYTQGVGQC